MNAVSPVYEIMEGAYIPMFMRARAPAKGAVAEDVRRKQVLARGSSVSVLGLVIGNIGGITALLIGIIITYGRGSAAQDGYHNFLLAITIAGCITIAFATVSLPRGIQALRWLGDLECCLHKLFVDFWSAVSVRARPW